MADKGKTPVVAQWLAVGGPGYARFIDTEGVVWRLRSRKGPDGGRIWLRETAVPTFAETDTFTADKDYGKVAKDPDAVLGSESHGDCHP